MPTTMLHRLDAFFESMRRLVLVSFVCGVGGCVFAGFEPVPPAPSGSAAGVSASGSSGAGNSGNGGNSGASASGNGGATMLAGHGGASGSAGQNNGGASGAAGTVAADAGPVDDSGDPPVGVTIPPIGCINRLDLAPCEDGNFCTNNDTCSGQVCVPGTAIPCDEECRTGECHELSDTCTYQERPDGMFCGLFLAGVCEAGECTAPPTGCDAGRLCTPACFGETCPTLDCQAVSYCAPYCDSAICEEVSCLGVSTCDAECTGQSTCLVECQDANICAVDCNSESKCEVRCDASNGSGSCEVECLSGSECTISCGDQSCGFLECWDVEEDCGDGTVVCGHGCNGG